MYKNKLRPKGEILNSLTINNLFNIYISTKLKWTKLALNGRGKFDI